MNLTADDPIWTQDIEVIPMVQAFPALGTIEEFNEKNVVLTKDHKRLFSVVSQKTQIIKHQEAVEMIDNAIKELYGGRSVIDLHSYKTGAQIKAKFTLPDEPEITIGKDDKNTLHLLLYNSYDRALSFKVRAGAYRFVCDNGMVLGEDIAVIKGRELLDGWSPEGVSNKIKEMMASVLKVKDLWQLWQDLEVSYLDSLEAIGSKLPKKMISHVEAQATSFPMPIWDFYNMLTAYSTHESASDRARTSFDGTISNIFYSPKSSLYKLYTQIGDIEEVEVESIEQVA